MSEEIEMSDMQLTDKKTLRERARKNVEEGAVTEGYSANREEILRLLNESLATEWVCVLRYKRHYFMATGIKAHVAAQEFLEHATQEMEHADKLAERILFLEGLPNFQLLGKLRIGENPRELLVCDLALENEALPVLREAIAYSETVGDYVSRQLLSDILESEEEHLDWIETQLSVIERIGEPNYLLSKLED